MLIPSTCSLNTTVTFVRLVTVPGAGCFCTIVGAPSARKLDPNTIASSKLTEVYAFIVLPRDLSVQQQEYRPLCTFVVAKQRFYGIIVTSFLRTRPRQNVSR